MATMLEERPSRARNGSTDHEVVVRVVGDGCQVENCTVDSCAQGIVLESKDTLCVRNRAIDNTTDFVFTQNNQVGPILKSQGFVTGGQPHANFGTPIP